MKTDILKQLGWDGHFDFHFSELKVENSYPARIFREQRNTYELYSENGEFTAKLQGRFRHHAKSKVDLPAVGDWVVVSKNDKQHEPVITHVLERKSFISRKIGTGRKNIGQVVEEQVIAANIDTIFIVSSLDREFNTRRIERYLTLVYNCGANPVIILNKTDLCDDWDDKIDQVKDIALGVPIHAISAKRENSHDELAALIEFGKTVALLGSSGVGKSTIINNLLGFDKQKTAEISDAVNKGKHTTTHRELIILPDGGVLMDNPGMRELLPGTEESDIQEAFSEIDKLAQTCKFRDCKHKNEPGCAVQKAISNNELGEERLESYNRLKRELHYTQEKQYKTARTVEREKWRQIYKDAGHEPDF